MTDEEKINVCRALASVFTVDEDVSEEEAAFVGRAALDLGLDESGLNVVQQSLGTHLKFGDVIAGVGDPALRRFLFRRLVAAVLIDDQVSDQEKTLIEKTAKTFGWDSAVAGEYVSWMKGFIEQEREGERILERLG